MGENFFLIRRNRLWETLLPFPVFPVSAELRDAGDHLPSLLSLSQKTAAGAAQSRAALTVGCGGAGGMGWVCPVPGFHVAPSLVPLQAEVPGAGLQPAHRLCIIGDL